VKRRNTKNGLCARNARRRGIAQTSVNRKELRRKQQEGLYFLVLKDEKEEVDLMRIGQGQ